jgi:hypothetical protein
MAVVERMHLKIFDIISLSLNVFALNNLKTIISH